MIRTFTYRMGVITTATSLSVVITMLTAMMSRGEIGHFAGGMLIAGLAAGVIGAVGGERLLVQAGVVEKEGSAGWGWPIAASIVLLGGTTVLAVLLQRHSISMSFALVPILLTLVILDRLGARLERRTSG